MKQFVVASFVQKKDSLSPGSNCTCRGSYARWVHDYIQVRAEFAKTLIFAAKIDDSVLTLTPIILELRTLATHSMKKHPQNQCEDIYYFGRGRRG